MHVVHICDVYNVSIVLVAYEFHAFKMKRLKRRNDQNIYINFVLVFSFILPRTVAYMEHSFYISFHQTFKLNYISLYWIII